MLYYNPWGAVGRLGFLQIRMTGLDGFGCRGWNLCAGCLFLELSCMRSAEESRGMRSGGGVKQRGVVIDNR